jgi:two-component system OmpR family sensor kinase
VTVGRPSAGGPAPKVAQIDWRQSLGLRLTLLVMAVVLLSLGFAFFVIDRSVSHGLGARTDDDLRSDVSSLSKAIGSPTSAQAALTAANTYMDSNDGDGPSRPTVRLLFVIGPKSATTGTNLVVTNAPQVAIALQGAAGAPIPGYGLQQAPTNGYGSTRPTGAGGDPFDPGNANVTAAQRAQELATARKQVQGLLSAPTGFSRVTLPGRTGPVRVYVVNRTYGGQTVKLAVATQLQPTNRAQSVVRSGFLLAGGFGILAALLGGTFVATRISRPLRRMAVVATEVDEGELDRRMGNTGRRDEIQVLAGSFDHMLERLQSAFERQRSFTADASHELRTPLTVIRGQLEVLSMQENPEPEEMRRVERLVRTEVDRMGRLVEDLLLLNRSETPNFVQRSPIDLPALLQGSVEGFELTADRRFELAELPDVVLDVDSGRVTQAVRNLVRNAVEHTEPGGLVRLSAELVTGDRRPDLVRIFVDDNGHGIPEDQREQVFERFHRAQVGRGADGGAGLGLAIVRSIADAHGGSVRADASPEGGARFVLELPLDAPRSTV